MAGLLPRASWLRGWRYQIAVLAAIVLAGVLTYLARTTLYFPIDVEVTRAIQSIKSPLFVAFLEAVGWIGYPPQVDVIVGLIVVGLWLAGRRIEAAMLLFAGLAGAGLWFGLSAFVDRPRPSPELVEVARRLPSGSFPSGHVLNLTAMFGYLAYLALVYLRDIRWRVLLVALLAIPVLTIGVARIHAGAHWPSDVLGGYLIGGILLALTIQAYRWAVARFRPDPGPTAYGPHESRAVRTIPASSAW
jgi:membrane-associated phospholipid phosphatase